MPIYHYPGYVTKQYYAKQRSVKVRTVNDWVAKRSNAYSGFVSVRVDGIVYIKDVINRIPPPEGFGLADL